jgi:pyruvate formate lyase activating enzyme
MQALFKKSDHRIQCLLCPHFCKIAEDKVGICGVRKNTGIKIELDTYGVLSGFSVDPVEKKPLYHFFPGSDILSVGSYGCNMKCDFCQNFHISQSIPKNLFFKTSPENLLSDALQVEKNIGVAFTYNEPVIWFEFMRDTAVLVKDVGLFTVMVSNGYVNSDPLSEIIQFIDAFNIDLKAFNNDFYQRFTGAEIEPVKSCLKQIARSGKHLEITTLILPGLNDSEKEMSLQIEWIAGELGKDVPFHISRYFPSFKRDDPPTSIETINSLYEIASKKLNFVYIGNSVSETGQNTVCPSCSTIVTTRQGYKTHLQNLDKEGNCSVCGNKIYKNFTFSSPTTH